jgi:thiol-disulfide isomerase/thioredoxin
MILKFKLILRNRNLEMENNTFYVLSEEYKKKKNEKKKNEKKEKKIVQKKVVCVNCKIDPVSYFDGGWKGWCASCKEIDEGLYNWQMACMEESSKPKKEQNMAVFLGQY